MVGVCVNLPVPPPILTVDFLPVLSPRRLGLGVLDTEAQCLG